MESWGWPSTFHFQFSTFNSQSQITMDEVGHELVEVEAGVATVDAVVFVGVDAELELFASGFEGSDHVGSILEMDVVVAGAVDEEVFAFEEVGEVEGRVVVVAAGVVLRTLEEALGVDIIVVAPGDDGSDSDGGFEDIVALEDGEGGQVAAKAPAEDTDAFFVDPALAAEIASGLDSVLALHLTEVAIGLFFEVCATAASATAIEADNDIALLGEHVEPVVVGIAIGVGDLLVAGAAIDIEEEGVLLGGVEIGGSDDIIVELGAEGGGEGAEGFAAYAVLGHTLTQIGIVLKGFEELALGGVEGIDGRSVGIGEGEDVVLAIVGESGGVGAGLLGELGLFLAFEIDAIELLVDGTGFVGEVVDEAVFLIDGADVDNIVGARGDLVDEAAGEVVHVDVVVAVALGGEEHVLAVGEEGPGAGHLDIGLVLLGVKGTNLAIAGIGKKEFHLVLQAVHAHECEDVGIAGPLNAGHVLIVLAADIELGGFGGFEVVDKDIDYGVVFASLGVFVGVIFGIELAPHLHGVLLDLGLVEAVEGDLLAIGAPVEALGDGEFLLIDPVGGAVDDLVDFAIEGDLGFFERGERHGVEVVVADEGNHLAIGREGGETLFAALSEALEGAVGYVIKIVGGDAGVAIDGLELGREEDFLLVLRELVALDGRQGLDGVAHGIAEGAYDIDFLAGFVAIFLDAGAGEDAVVLAVLHGADGGDAHGAEGGFGPDILQGDFFGLGGDAAEECNHGH